MDIVVRATNLDMSLFRNLSLTERMKLQSVPESLNISNTPHFGICCREPERLELQS